MVSAVERDGRAVVTTCGGCYADCAFAARVEDGRVVAELPVPGHPCAARALCARGRHRLAMPFDERDRILHPMRRRQDGSGFDAVSWDEAFSDIAERLAEIIDEHSARALGMTLGVPSFDRYWAYRFMHALGSPNVYGADGACEVSRLTGWEHSLGYSPASDLAHTDCIMYLGRSIVDSSTMGAVDALNDARRRGAKIIVVDPRRSGSAALADRWLRVRPGCDLALLLGIAHVLIAENLYDHDFVARYTTGFDELAQAAGAWTPEWAESMCDVPADDIRATARDLAAAAPAAVVDAGFHGGIGIAYANSTQTARAICLVDVLLGCIGHAGGALNPPTPLVLGDLDPARFATPPVPRVPKLGSERYPLVDPVRGLCTTIGQSILAGDLRGLIVYASNPGAGYGNADAWLGILQQLDLLVTIDIRWSETARASDYVLPDVTYLEADRGVGTVVGRNDARVFYRNAVLPVLHDDTRPGRRSLPAWLLPAAWASILTLRPTTWRQPRWLRLGSILPHSRSAVGQTRACRCRRVRASRWFLSMAARLRWQTTYGSAPAWVVCLAGLRPWWSRGWGCFASLAATGPLSRTLRADLLRRVLPRQVPTWTPCR